MDLDNVIVVPAVNTMYFTDKAGILQVTARNGNSRSGAAARAVYSKNGDVTESHYFVNGGHIEANATETFSVIVFKNSYYRVQASSRC